MMMKCDKAYDRLHELIDRPISECDSALRAHVDGCARCADVLEQHRVIASALAGIELDSPSPGFADGVIARLRADGRIADESTSSAAVRRRMHRVVARGGARSGWLRGRYRVPAIAAMLLLVALALFPATIQPLIGIAGNGAVAIVDGVVQAQRAFAELSPLDTLRTNLTTLKTLLLAGFSLLASVGEIFLLPALGMILALVLGIVGYFRVVHRRNTHHATFSF
jgi:hypothetical protein